MPDSDVSIKSDSYIWQNNGKSNNKKIISTLTLEPPKRGKKYSK